ncbi:MAG: polysaccharide biosynthesis tyrosine autokinase [Bacteroidales bacterium]|nr:polysaccharide biosynthesis tyrosine autokinase [Candidatus Sodaliphilus fimicaballi]
MDNQTINKHNDEFADDALKVQEWIGYLVKKWRWYLFFIIVSLLCGSFYYLTSEPFYVRKAAVLITDNESSSISNQFSQFSAFGVSAGRSNVYNEIQTFISPSYMLDVVKRENLEIEYRVEGFFRQSVIYGKDLPIKVLLSDLKDEDVARFKVEILKDNSLQLSDFQIKTEDSNEFQAINKVVKGSFDKFISTPIGKVLISKSEYYATKHHDVILVNKGSLLDVTHKYVSRLDADLNEQKASVIGLELHDESPKRAEDILNTLVDVYNSKWMDDINQQAVSTSKFIDEELAQIESELGNVDANIADYKSANNIPDIQASTQLNIHRSESLNSQRMELNNQKYIASYIRNKLSNETTKYESLPANSGIESSSIDAQISAYNTLLSQRNNYIANSGANNPIVLELDQTLSATRKSIISALDNVIVNLNNRIADVKGVEGATNRQISESPIRAKYLLSVERQQKVKEQLYVFLLQKRAETQMTKAYNSKTKLLNPPAGAKRHAYPVKINVLSISLTLGLLLATMLLTLMYNMDTTVHSRKEIEMLTMPFIGEIPLNYKSYSGLLSFLNKRKEVREIVVKDKSNDLINEAFRVVRTNLEFVVGKERKSNVIMFTSAFPGSGKTYISTNLSTAFAISGKRVLLIDLDLRKGTSSKLITSSTIGVSNYLSGNVENINDIIIKDSITSNFDVIPIGVIPPNPTELLYSDRLSTLIDAVKDQYDYIFLDCPPLGIVADASIITKMCDMTIFIIRAGLFERNMLPEIDSYYKEKRYNNLCILLNGVKEEYHPYGRYGDYA